MNQTKLFISSAQSGAAFSECRKYRYSLWRIWDEQKPLIMFIGLNPSTANEDEPDPTITRVIDFAKRWGYGGVYMMNLFTYVSKNPNDLLECGDPMWHNYKLLKKISVKCETVVFAWGAFKQAKKRAAVVIKMFPGAHALKKTKDGSPWHPLYVAGNTRLIKYIS